MYCTSIKMYVVLSINIYFTPEVSILNVNCEHESYIVFICFGLLLRYCGTVSHIHGFLDIWAE